MTTLSRIDKIAKSYTPPATITLGGTIPGADVALLPVRTGPTAATVWTATAYANGQATITLAGPEADSSGALVVTGDGDLWMRVTEQPYVQAVKIERITLLGGSGTVTAPPSPFVSSVVGQTGVVTGTEIAADPALRAAYVPRGIADRAFLIVGGDHPYPQWGGNGMAKAYRDRNLTPYMAVNSDAGGIEPGGAGMLTWAGLSDPVSRGVEIIAHGARHIQDWTRINTGIQVLYNGANATATVQITATQLIATAGAGDSVTVNLAGATLAQVQAAVQAAGAWTVTLAPELTGSEPAGCLLQIAAVSVKGTTTRFAAGGGITIVQSSTKYRQTWVLVQSGHLKLYGDGRRLLDLTLAGLTLSSVVSSLNGITGFNAYLCDNQKSVTSTFESYVSGNELAVSLVPTTGSSCNGYPAVIAAGLPRWYMIDRQFQRCVDQAAANGVTLRDFASSGNDFTRDLIHGHTQFGSTRGNALYNVADPTYSQAPVVPARLGAPFRPVQALTLSSYPSGSGRLTALVRALADSPGFVADTLMHKVLADGSSGLSFPSGPDDSYYDQTETDFIAFLDAVKTQIDAGKIVNVPPSRVREVLASAPSPANLVFNPKFQTSGEALVPASEYRIVPGWRTVTSSADYSALTRDSNGGLNATVASTTLTYPVAQLLYMEPGKTYEIGFLAEISNYTSGLGVGMSVNTLRGWERNDAYNGSFATLSRYATGLSEHVKMRYTVPAPEEFQHARIISLSFGAGIDMSVNKNIKLKFWGKTLDNLDLSAGAASVTSVKAVEAAAAINNALLAAVKAGTFNGEFLNLARSENNSLILEVPVRAPDTSFTLFVTAATTADITTTVFGSTDNIAYPQPASDQDGLLMGLEFRIQHQLAVGTSYRISRPYCTEISLQ